MRKWILNIHLYGGLLCVPYLIIFGISSLNFNHHFAFAKAQDDHLRWERPLTIALGTNDAANAERVREDLGLAGWTLPWEMKRSAAGDLHIAVSRPGRQYQIDIPSGQPNARVDEKRTGFWPILNSLHGMTRVPGVPISRAWGLYTELAVWIVLFSAASGVYLWAISKRERRAGLAVVSAAVVATLALMIYVVVRG